jgi:hypothetical protein
LETLGNLLNVQAGQLKNKIGSISNLGQHIDNFHAGVGMVTPPWSKNIEKK